MDNLRSRRGRPAKRTTETTTTTKTPPSSPPKQKSPIRKSPSRRHATKSPALRVLPSRKAANLQSSRSQIQSEISTTTSVTTKTSSRTKVTRSSSQRDSGINSKVVEDELKYKLLTPRVYLEKLQVVNEEASLTSTPKKNEKTDKGKRTVLDKSISDQSTDETGHGGGGGSDIINNIDDSTDDLLEDDDYNRRSLSRSISHSLFDEQTEYSDNDRDDYDDDQDTEYERTKYNISRSEDMRKEYTNNVILNSDVRRSSSQKRFLKSIEEFYGNIGSLFLLIFIPLYTILIHYFCTKDSCAFHLVTKLSENYKDYINLKLWGYHVLLQVLVLLGTLILNGKVTTVIAEDRSRPSKYIFNGLFTQITTMSIFILIIWYFKLNLINMILENYLQLVIMSILNGLIIAFVSHIRARGISRQWWNPYARQNKIWMDFFVGREITPTFINGRFDLKMSYNRLSWVLTFLLNVIFIYKSVTFVIPNNDDKNWIEFLIEFVKSVQIDRGVLVSAGLTLAYVFDLFYHEYQLVNSFELQSEGFGGLCLLRYSCFPFLYSLLPKYALEHELNEIPIWAIVIIVSVFSFGIWMKSASREIKLKYRLNPYLTKFISKLYF